MSYLRHAPRQVHATVVDYVKAGLAELGWTSSDASERPFGAAQVTVRTTSPVAGTIGKVDNGTVAITLGTSTSPMDLELGGPLTEQPFPIFIDVLMDEEGLALSLASDIFDHLRGRFEFSRRSLLVVDQVTQAPAPGWVARLEDLERIRPDNALTLHWQVVHVTAVAEFNDVLFGGASDEDGGDPADQYPIEDGGVL